MKKKLIGILLAVFMVAALVPVMALAEADTETRTNWGKLNNAMHGKEQATVEDVFEVDDSTPGVREIKLLTHIVGGYKDNDLKVSAAGEKKIILDLNGYALVGNYSNNIITVESNGVFTLNDSSTEKNGKVIRGRMMDYQNGGGVYVNGGSFTMNGGTISDNYAEGFGGGVYVKSGSFIMNGGTISGNTSGSNGGGVYVKSGSFTMTGGEISGNRATDGGGAYVYEGSFTMTGGNITGNTAVFGSGVCFSQCDAILGGTARIKDNMRRDYEKMPQNLYVRHNQKITIGTDDKAPQEGMDIGVTMAFNTGQFTTNGSPDDAQYFSADKTANMIKYNEGGYLEVVEKVPEESADPQEHDPAQPKERSKSPATGITGSDRVLPAVVGFIALAVVGAGLVLIRRKQTQ